MSDPGRQEEDVDLAVIRRDIEGCADSHRRLVDHLSELGDVDPAAPSRLPDWTIGHVATHIARNADSVLRMLDGLPQYWKGVESRNADIALGAGRAWDELVADVVTTCAAVEQRMRETTDWSGAVVSTVANRPKASLPGPRRREVEVHRVDLGLGYEFADMPNDYVRIDMRLTEMMWKARQPMGMTPLPKAVLALAEHERLAWMFGRIEVAGVPPAGIY